MIIIAYGANLNSSIGAPEKTYAKLPEILLQHGIEVLKASPLYKTAPVPVSDQPDYYNGVLTVQAALQPVDLLKALHVIEKALGRNRTVQNAARGIDLDVIAYDDVVTAAGAVIIPHPRMHDRDFVLRPLCDIAPDWQHPARMRTAKQLLNALEGA